MDRFNDLDIPESLELRERVVALGAQLGAGMSSRAEVASDFAVVFVARNSQTLALDADASWKAAVEAGGLAE